MPLFPIRPRVDEDQDLAQHAELMRAGCAKVFKEKASGAKPNRPELAKAIRHLEPGDVLGGQPLCLVLLAVDLEAVLPLLFTVNHHAWRVIKPTAMQLRISPRKDSGFAVWGEIWPGVSWFVAECGSEAKDISDRSTTVGLR